MDHTLCKSEFLSFLIFIFPNRKRVAFVKNTLSDEYVEIILGEGGVGGREKKNQSNFEWKHICLSLGKTDGLVATAAFAALGNL